MLQFGHNVRKKSYLNVMSLNTRRHNLDLGDILGGKHKTKKYRRANGIK